MPDANACFKGHPPEQLWLNVWSKTLVLTTIWPLADFQDDGAAALCILEACELSKRAAPAPKLYLSLEFGRLLDSFSFPEIKRKMKLIGIKQPFRRVEELQLRFSLHTEEPDDEFVSNAAAGIAEWLRSATQLTMLDISIDKDPTFTMDYLSKARFPKLKTFQLSAACKSHVLASFLTNNSSSLRYVFLNSVSLNGETWASFLPPRLPTRLPGLDTLGLGGFFDEDGHERYPRKFGFTYMVKQPTWFQLYLSYMFRHGESRPWILQIGSSTTTTSPKGLRLGR